MYHPNQDRIGIKERGTSNYMRTTSINCNFPGQSESCNQPRSEIKLQVHAESILFPHLCGKGKSVLFS